MRLRPLALASLLCLAAAPASAQTRPLAEAFSVAREGECLTDEALLEHLATWLRRDTIDARLSIVVEEEGAGASFVVLHDGVARAARRFDRLPAACPDRRAALGLAIAMAIDSAVLDELVPPREEREEPEEVEIPPAPQPAGESEPDPEPAVGVALEVAIEGQALFEVLPEVAAGWQVGARLVIDDVVEIGAAAWITSVSGADLQPGRVDAQLAGGRLDLCVRRSDDVTIRGCAGVATGVGRGQGHDVDGARETLVPFLGLLGRLGLAFRLTDWLALELAGDAWIALVRPRFDLVSASGTVARSAALPLAGAVASLGLSVRFR